MNFLSNNIELCFNLSSKNVPSYAWDRPPVGKIHLRNHAHVANATLEKAKYGYDYYGYMFPPGNDKLHKAIFEIKITDIADFYNILYHLESWLANRGDE